MRAALFLALVAGTVAGCGGGPKTGMLTGTVTVNGKPLKAGTVTFAPKVGTEAPVTVAITDGRYTAGGVPYGELGIGVQPPAAVDGATATGKPDPSAPPPPPPPPPPAWVTKSADPLSSGLKVTLDAPNKEHNIDIK